MLDQSQKLEILSRILQSPQFKDSRRSQELLQYLFDASLADKSPKEITIAMDFFGKAADFDPKSDPTVRVQINYLRKKLEHFYLVSKEPHEFRLDIPKGHYAVEFIPAPPASMALPAPRETRVIVLASVVVILSLVIAILLLTGNGRPVASASDLSGNPIWAEFSQPAGRPTLIVLGDYYFLFDKTIVSKPGVIVRFPQINSQEDLRVAIRQDPTFAQRYVQSDFTYLRPSSSWGLSEVLPVLRQTPGGYSLKLASQLTLDDLKTHNIVFIGSFKTLHSLNRILDHFEFQYQFAPASLTVKSERPDSGITFYPQNFRGGEYERDYAVIAKGLGPEGNTMLLILGFGDSGVLQAAKIAVDPSLTERIEENFGKRATAQPLYCNIVIEVEGINQTSFKWALKFFKRIQQLRAPSGAAR